MAKGVQIPIEVVDKFSKQLGDMDARLNAISKSAEKQQKAFNLLSADVIIRYGREAGNAVIQFGKDAVRAFEEQESANRRLQIAMQNLGVYTEASWRKQLAFAESLQGSTTFADEQVVELQALLTTFGLYGAKLDQVTKATLDLSTAQKVDLNSAALLLGKAFAGETSSLSRYGIIVDEAGSKAQKFEAVLAQIQRRFGGAAAAEVDTHAGKVKQLANAFSDLQEKVGEDLAHDMDGVITALGKLAKAANDNYDPIKRVMGLFERPAPVIAAWLAEHGAKVGLLKGEYSALYSILMQIQGAAANVKPKDAGGNAAPPPPGEDPAIAAARAKIEEEAELESFGLAERSRRYIEERTFTNEQLADMDAERMAAQLEAEGQFEASRAVIQARGLERDRQISVQRITATRNMFAMLASLQTAKTKEIAILGKAAAFATAMINAHLAASQALAAFAAIPPLAIAMSSLMYAAGAAQAMQIAGVPLKEGGIAMPKPGGLIANLAENGEPEVVAPLWKLRAMLGLDEGGIRGGRGGASVSFGDINVTVQAQDVGSPADRRSLAEQLVEELRRAAAPAIEASILMAQTAQRYPARAA